VQRDWRIHFERKFVGDQTAKSRLVKVQVTESQFADDLALYTVTQAALESTSRRFVEVASCCGLTVSQPKTKGLAIGLVRMMFPGGGEIEMVKDFDYLGSKLPCDGEITAEVCYRIAKVSKAFGCTIFLNQTLSVDTKRAMYKAIIIPFCYTEQKHGL